MQQQYLNIVASDSMDAALYGIMCLSLVLSLLVVVILLKNIFKALGACFSWCRPKSRTLLKPTFNLSHEENIKQKMIFNKQDQESKGNFNDRTPLKNDFVAFYA